MTHLLQHGVPEPPPGYRSAYFLVVTTRRNLLWLNLGSVLLFALGAALTFGLLLLYDALGAPLRLAIPGGGQISVAVGLVSLLGLLLVHEWIHGLAIQATGHQPRYGAKPLKLVFYATADGVYFTRREYLVVTLAPLVSMTLVGLAVALFIPPPGMLWLGLLVSINIASSIGDVWMARVALRFPLGALYMDHEDGLSIYLPTDL